MEITIQRKVDELGRVVLPIEMRQALSLGEKATVNIRCDNDKITIENAAACCKLCHTGDGPLTRSGNDCFCTACIERIKGL